MRIAGRAIGKAAATTTCHPLPAGLLGGSKQTKTYK